MTVTLELLNKGLRLYKAVYSYILLCAAGCSVHICDFHREQCWLRWTSLSKHGVHSKRDEVLDLLRRVARALTVEDYQAHLLTLQTSAVWRECAPLQQWFTRTWLPEHKVCFYCVLLMSL